MAKKALSDVLVRHFLRGRFSKPMKTIPNNATWLHPDVGGRLKIYDKTPAHEFVTAPREYATQKMTRKRKS